MENLKIVVIEDSKSTQKLLVAALVNWGYTVAAAESAEQALTIIDAEAPNIVITDWMLPGIDGPTLCSKIRQLETGNYIYLIIITGLKDLNNVVDGLAAGADDFMRKPINFQELKARLASAKRIINLEDSLIRKNKYLSSISEKINQLNSQLMLAQSKVDQDIKFAERIQRNVLPKNEVKFDNLDFQYKYCPSMSISGDIFNYFAINSQIVCFYSIDVCGHGVASAMMSYSINQVITQTLGLDEFITRLSKEHDLFENPHYYVDYLNKIYYRSDDWSLYFTMIFGFINLQTGKLYFCQAGHPSPIFQHIDGKLELLGGSGFPVGLLPHATYESISVNFQKGERIFLYSDGITDCTDSQDQPFDTTRLLAFLKESSHMPIKQMLTLLHYKLVKWHGSDSFEDDLSILGIEFC